MRLISTFLICIGILFSSTIFAKNSVEIKDKRIVVIEYLDYNCPVCRAYASTLDRLAFNNPNLILYKKVVPVLAPNSQLVDRAVLASKYQGKYEAMRQAIIASPFNEFIPNRAVFEIAKNVGLDIHRLYQDMSADEVSNEIVQNIKGYAKAKELRVPVVQIYIQGESSINYQFVGMQSYAKLQSFVDNIKERIYGK